MAFRSILVPIDFSEGSQAALRLALEVAREGGASLTLLHVNTVPMPLVGPLGWPAIDTDQMARTARAELERLIDQLPLPRNTVLTEVLSGDPGFTIVERARRDGVDLIVMGTHGRTGLKHLVVGSVAERVVRHSPCPVLTVPQPTP